MHMSQKNLKQYKLRESTCALYDVSVEINCYMMFSAGAKPLAENSVARFVRILCVIHSVRSDVEEQYLLGPTANWPFWERMGP